MIDARGLLACAFVLLSVSAKATAASQSHRLDDRGTFSVPAVPMMQWQSWRGAGTRSLMIGQFDMHLKLNTSQWVGRSVRVYLSLERDQNSVVDLAWEPGSRLIGGRVSSGDRALIFSGVVASPLIEDVLKVQMASEPDWNAASRRLQVHFDVEAQ